MSLTEPHFAHRMTITALSPINLYSYSSPAPRCLCLLDFRMSEELEMPKLLIGYTCSGFTSIEMPEYHRVGTGKFTLALPCPYGNSDGEFIGLNRIRSFRGFSNCEYRWGFQLSCWEPYTLFSLQLIMNGVHLLFYSRPL